MVVIDPHRKPSRLLAAALCALLAAACESAPALSTTWAGTVDTLSSGRVVVRNPDAPSWREGEAWTLRERLRLGTLEGDGADVFGEIRDVELGPDGELYVLDAQASQVRIFGPDGAHLRTFGRAGEGPGELSRAAGITVGTEGEIWVLNTGNNRYTAFDPATGELLREVRRPAAFSMIPWPGRMDRAGRLLDVGLGNDGQPAILGLDSAFAPVDTLAMPRASDQSRIFFRRGNLIAASMMDPFAPQPSWSAHPAGGIVVGEGGEYRLHRIGLSGDTTLTIEVAREPEPTSGADRDSALALFRRHAAELTDGAIPDREPRVHGTKPAHGAIFVGDAGHVWVRRTPEAGAAAAWDVFAPDGRLLGSVSSDVVPSYVAPAASGGRLAMVTTVDGVPSVVVYDLIVPGVRAPATPSAPPS